MKRNVIHDGLSASENNAVVKQFGMFFAIVMAPSGTGLEA